MVDYFIYAKDYLNSTNGAEYHPSNVLKTIELFKCDVEKIKEHLVTEESPRQSKIIYLHWGDDCWDVDEGETKTSSVDVICQRKDRDLGCIVRHLQRKYIIGENDKIKLLYISTNGMINRESIDEFFELNKFMHYETVVFHAFNENPEKIDLSLDASFFKSRCMVYRNGELCESTDIFKDVDYEKINDGNFAAIKPELKSYIKLKYSNKSIDASIALHEIIKLMEIRDRLVNELSSNRPKHPLFEGNFTVEERNYLILTFDEDEYKRRIIASYEMKSEVHKFVTAMIKYIENEEQFESFDVVKSIDEEQIDDTNNTNDEVTESFDFALVNGNQCPIFSFYIE